MKKKNDDAMVAVAKKLKSAVVDQILPELFLMAIGAAPIEYSEGGWTSWWPPGDVECGWFLAGCSKM